MLPISGKTLLSTRCNSHCHCIAAATYTLFTLSLPSVVCINFTILTFTTMYRAYHHQETALLAFMSVIYGSHFIVELADCSRLPKGEKSTKKELLRFCRWFLPTAVLVGLTIEFGTLVTDVTALVLMYCFAIACCSLSFYVHYIQDDQKGSSSVDQKSNKKHDQAPIADNIV